MSIITSGQAVHGVAGGRKTTRKAQRQLLELVNGMKRGALARRAGSRPACPGGGAGRVVKEAPEAGGRDFSGEAPGGGTCYDLANQQVVMTACVGPTLCVMTEATADRSDRAHNLRDGTPDRMLIPAGKLSGGAERHARPRRYPGCYMAGPPEERVSVETVFERTAAAQAAIQMHDGGNVADARERLLSALREGGRDWTRRPTVQVDCVTGEEHVE